MTGRTPGLALMERLNGTRKWAFDKITEESELLNEFKRDCRLPSLESKTRLKRTVSRNLVPFGGQVTSSLKTYSYQAPLKQTNSSHSASGPV